MKIPFFQRKKKTGGSNKRGNSGVGVVIPDALCESLEVSGYTRLDRCPEVMTACHRIAELIGSITIYLMENRSNGDVRIVNELSRKIDIDPIQTMTRKTWMESIVMTMLLYGEGNAIVWPHTWDGHIASLEPIAASRVSLLPQEYRDYKILIDGRVHLPENMLHFVHNPDPVYLWKGRGLRVSLRDVATNLKQAAATEKAFMESKWKPSLIVKADAMTDAFRTPEGRAEILKDYFETTEAGSPWIIPAEQFEVQEVRPLTLSDLAINDTVKLDKQAVAAILGVPAFVVGVGEFNRDAWNNFIQNTIRTICDGIAQELTKKLILNPKWYLKFATHSLMDWDLKTIADVFGNLSDRGIVTGNEVRDRIGMSPADGLDEHRILENYLPYDMSGKQKKLVQEGEP